MQQQDSTILHAKEKLKAIKKGEAKATLFEIARLEFAAKNNYVPKSPAKMMEFYIYNKAELKGKWNGNYKYEI